MYTHSDGVKYGVPGRGVPLAIPYQKSFNGLGQWSIVAAGITAAAQVGATAYQTTMQQKLATEQRRTERAEAAAQREHEIEMMKLRQEEIAKKALLTAGQPTGDPEYIEKPTGTIQTISNQTTSGIPKWVYIAAGGTVLLVAGLLIFKKKRR